MFPLYDVNVLPEHSIQVEPTKRAALLQLCRLPPGGGIVTEEPHYQLMSTDLQRKAPLHGQHNGVENIHIRAQISTFTYLRYIHSNNIYFFAV